VAWEVAVRERKKKRKRERDVERCRERWRRGKIRNEDNAGFLGWE